MRVEIKGFTAQEQSDSNHNPNTLFTKSKNWPVMGKYCKLKDGAN